MEFKENRISVPLEHYKTQYQKLDPAEAAKRCNVPFDENRGVFTLKFLNRNTEVTYPKLSASYPGSEDTVSDYEVILLGRYLLEGRYTEPTGKLLAYAEMPWGDVYIEPFKGRCLARLAYGFGFKLDKFAAACEALGGKKADAGDVSYDLPLLAGFTMRLILWAGDDEFPPSAQILFSDNFPNSFTAEDMAAAGDVVIGKLKQV